MRKLLPLTGLRAIAALWVVLFHFRYLFSFGWLNPIIDKGYLGVDLFFVLSGFIIAYVHQRDFSNWPLTGQDVKRGFRFLALRCARMLPVHYVTLGMLILMDCGRAVMTHQSIWSAHAVPGDAKRDLFLHLLNLQGWGLSDHNSWNVPAWSISSEWFAYLLFPVIALLVLPRLKSVAAPLLMITLCFWGFSSFVNVMHLPGIDWTVHYSLIRVTVEFAIGCALCVLFHHTVENARWAGPVSAISLLLVLQTVVLHGPDVLAVFGLTGLILGLAVGGHFLAKVLSIRPMLYLGEISFSTYMMYAPIVLLFNSIEFHSHWMERYPTALLCAGLLLTQVTSASLLFFCVEKPARDLLRRHLIDRFLGKTDPKRVTQTIVVAVPATAEPAISTLPVVDESVDEPVVLSSQLLSSRILPTSLAHLAAKIVSPASIATKLSQPSEALSQARPRFMSWKPFSDEALDYQPIRRIVMRPKQQVAQVAPKKPIRTPLPVMTASLMRVDVSLAQELHTAEAMQRNERKIKALAAHEQLSRALQAGKITETSSSASKALQPVRS